MTERIAVFEGNAIKMHEEYNKHHVLSQCDDVILEAKRVLLNEDIDKIASLALSDSAEENVSKKYCRQTLQWNDVKFWDDIPNPKNDCQVKSKHCKKIELNQDTLQIINKINEVQNKSKVVLANVKRDKKNKQLLQQYFERWHIKVVKRRENRKLREEMEIQTTKLNRFMTNLKNFQKNQSNKDKILDNLKPISDSDANTENFENDKHESSTNSDPSSEKTKRRQSFDGSLYKNRFEAQKSIIKAQKEKLEAQEKQIQELKIGIIREELMKSMQDTKINIREVFSNCSERVKCKIMPQLEFVQKEREKFMLCTQKAPRVIQQMEKRALERALKREIILERKRLMEENRKRLLEEAIENKRIQDEEERKQNLEAIKKQRQKELELEKIRQMNKQMFLNKLERATNFHNKLLLKKSFGVLKDFYITMRMNNIISEDHYRDKLLRNAWKILYGLVEDKYKIKYKLADELYNGNILRYSFRNWREMYIESVRSMQVAEDLYDFRLQSNTFVHWHRYVCVEIMATEKKMVKAKNLYNRRILFQYFYQWRSLPTVLQLEKAKEEKKRKWRERVWEIVPDYKPPEDDF